jgi:hypothetical protein
MAIVSLLTSAAKLSLVTAECRPREGDANPSGSPREREGFELSVPREEVALSREGKRGGGRSGWSRKTDLDPENETAIGTNKSPAQSGHQRFSGGS